MLIKQGTEKKLKYESLTEEILGAAFTVHAELGPGLLESAYEACLAYELRACGHQVVSQYALPITYKGLKLDTGYRIDLLVNDSVILELKCVERISSLHHAQLLSYMKLSNKMVGLLLNFNTLHLKLGIKRIVL